MVLAAGLVAGLLAASPMGAMAGGRGDASEIIVDYSASGRQQYDATSRELEARLAATPPILSQQTIYFTQIAIKRYEDIAAAGGWPQVQTKDVLRLGNNSATVAQLRRRLVASGERSAHFFHFGLGVSPGVGAVCPSQP